MNEGFDKAKGKYVALFDHDDVMTPKRLQIQYDYMESHPDIAACGGSMKEFGVSSNLLMSVPGYEEIILEMLARKRRYICNPCGFLRKEVIDRYSLRYKRGYSFNADIKYWSDVLQIGKVVNLPEVLIWYRTSDKQTSRVTRIESQKAAEVIFQEHAEFFISRVMDADMRDKLENRLMPVLKKLADFSVFSNRRYFFFLYELINGLYRNGFINLSEPLYESKIKS
ncbi:glycosyltransferase [uncultured Proteiniphilum sp.]|uniref:glycosyltransferase n=1 Tax=uncultured Proteiniphilum sp. TaxID=497637 RepID=UPI002605FED9|nr:glycosyltransferase [uncultured Proteiniphilum sp.]